MTRKLSLFLIVTSSLFVAAARAQDDTLKIPDEVRLFVEKPLIPIALESGDLNGDGRKDFILVLSQVIRDNAEWEEGGGSRSVLLLVRGSDEKLSVAGRNDEAAMCKNCGGVFGDPFAGVSIRGTSFTVSNYGGSNDRWAYDYTFGYSRRDNNWQLVRVVETTFHALDPARTEKKRVYTPPKSFGLINFNDFRPEDYLGKGKK